MTELSNQEMVPPWEEFPTYERDTIGWRMGSGEQYRHDWSDSIEILLQDDDTRKAYLSRHRPAPINWTKSVLWVLDPNKEWDEESESYAAEKLKLLEQGLIAHDAAYQTWLQQESAIVWPWQICDYTPEEFVRYQTRDFWFFSRQYAAVKQSGELQTIEDVPHHWKSVEPQLLTGRLGMVDPAQGLLAIAQMLCVGEVQPPWLLGLSPDDFTDSFEMDMGYVDAFRLWMMSAFDDDVLLRQLLSVTGVPTEWSSWIEENSMFG